MRTIRIGVVEDDPVACQRVLDYLNRYSSENEEDFTVSVFNDGEALVQRYAPVYDILLLDIEMKKMNGMEAAKHVRECDNTVVIVFITAAPQYAIGGYEVGALSYLLKPVPWFAFSQELKRSIDTVLRNINESIIVETGGQQLRIDLPEIIYIESIRHTILIHSLQGKISVPGTLKDYDARLNEHNFYRSNSCYIVNLRHVVAVEDQDCVLSNGEKLRISRPRKKAFLSALAHYISVGSQ